jgi:hypothetical protein
MDVLPTQLTKKEKKNVITTKPEEDIINTADSQGDWKMLTDTGNSCETAGYHETQRSNWVPGCLSQH